MSSLRHPHPSRDGYLHRMALIGRSLPDRTPLPKISPPDFTSLQCLVQSRGSCFRGAGAKVYNLNQFMYSVLELCSWSDLMTMSHASRLGREQVLLLIRSRIARFLGRIVPQYAFTDFFTTLAVSKAAIYGSIPWAVFTVDVDLGARVIPRDLNIVIPNGLFQIWLEFFNSIGFKNICTLDPLPLHLHGVATMGYRMWKNNRLTITITESCTSKILPVILSSPVTTHMNVITSSHLFCFYPGLTAQRRAVAGFMEALTSISSDLFKRSVLYSLSPRYFSAQCGLACPGLWRRTRGLPGVGVIKWDKSSLDLPPVHDGVAIRNGTASIKGSGSTAGTTDGKALMIWDAYSEFANSRFKWRTGVFCLNPRCPFNSLNKRKPVVL
ncbi:hypothetical protein Hypma_002447 [Hypsizygus marmoreus]|uniref:Uncharacterized protein n=1 Tax=Hypsizygus marmoreus TaxID=39966 RepID=A0A369JAX7_HYPMA|nr:hypothetical protein Hypma_002447 [Hypsizygus marmoreus]